MCPRRAVTLSNLQPSFWCETFSRGAGDRSPVEGRGGDVWEGVRRPRGCRVAPGRAGRGVGGRIHRIRRMSPRELRSSYLCLVPLLPIEVVPLFQVTALDGVPRLRGHESDSQARQIGCRSTTCPRRPSARGQDSWHCAISPHSRRGQGGGEDDPRD